MKNSAGVVLYRKREGKLEVLLVHPGGPFWAKKDWGAWSIPKGEAEAGEDLLERARREFKEETGLVVDGKFDRLTSVKQSNKMVHAWALEGDVDADSVVSNNCELEFPPRSGRRLTVPEVDKAAWFDMSTAREKIISGQRGLLDQLEERYG